MSFLHFRPDFAPESSSGEESDTEFNLEKKKNIDNEPEREEVHEAVIEDRRLKRLQEREVDSDDEDDRCSVWQWLLPDHILYNMLNP